MPTQNRDTYDRWILKSIMPAAGWHAVYCVDGAHQAFPVSALALAHQRTYDARTWAIIPDRYGSEDDDWHIVALDYMPGDGWNVCEDSGNYCGLLPPGMTLEAFAESAACRHAEAPADVEAAV